MFEVGIISEQSLNFDSLSVFGLSSIFDGIDSLGLLSWRIYELLVDDGVGDGPWHLSGSSFLLISELDIELGGVSSLLFFLVGGGEDGIEDGLGDVTGLHLLLVSVLDIVGEGDSLLGSFRVGCNNIPLGLGSWDLSFSSLFLSSVFDIVCGLLSLNWHLLSTVCDHVFDVSVHNWLWVVAEAG